jgi:Spy/CpxP family protein refolding chaperone
MRSVGLVNCCVRALLLLTLGGLFLLLPTNACAQAAKVENPEAQNPRHYKASSIDSRVNIFAKNLDLSDAQKSAVKRILEERQQQSLRIRQDSSISGADRIEQFRILQHSTVARIRAVLNEEQRKKYEPFATEKLKPTTPERSVEDWLKLTTPH